MDGPYHRWLMLGDKRHEQLTLSEVRQYGQDSFGDPDYVSIYGSTPGEWYRRGVRILGRTAVECTRDRLADLIGRDIAAVAPAAPGGAPVVADLFAGSGNTLHWISRHTGARRAIGFERDAAVFELTRRNLAIAGLGIEVIHDGYRHGLQALTDQGDDLLIVFVAPPWGRALGQGSGLDLRRTEPPVAEVIDDVTGLLGRRRLLFAVQVYESVEPGSLAEVTGRFPWWAMKVYDINAPGHNHGILLASWGWTPA